jgi:hypothetical protein
MATRGITSVVFFLISSGSTRRECCGPKTMVLSIIMSWEERSTPAPMMQPLGMIVPGRRRALHSMTFALPMESASTWLPTSKVLLELVRVQQRHDDEGLFQGQVSQGWYTADWKGRFFKDKRPADRSWFRNASTMGRRSSISVITTSAPRPLLDLEPLISRTA